MPTQNGRPGFGPTFQNRDGSVSPRAMSRNNFKYCKDFWLACETGKFGGGAATGTAGDVNVLRTGNPWAVEHEYGIIGTQTIISPVLTVSPTGYGGLDVTLDETLNDGMEIVFGASESGVARGKLAFKIGTDRAFFARLRVYLTDVSGGVLYFGFRKAQALDTIANYTDYALIGLVDDTGNISTTTRLNTGSATTTDTGQDWADTTQHELMVKVSNSGAVTYFLDGDRLYAPPSFTFDTGDVVIPMFRHQHTTDVSDDVILVGSIANDYCFEGGYQKKFGSFDGV